MTPQRVYGDTFWRLLAPIRPLLEEPGVNEVLVNGPEQVFVERNGRLEQCGRRFAGRAELLAALRSAAQYAGEAIDHCAQRIELTLPDGFRLWAVLPPLARDGPLVRIRRPICGRASLAELSRAGVLAPEVADLLSSRVQAGSNIMVAGGSRSGKTTLLAALAAAIPAGQRVLVLDHGRELRLDHDHVVYLDVGAARFADEPERRPFDPLQLALSLRPDCILLGELRGCEVRALTRIMALGTVQCLTALEARSVHDGLRRVEGLARSSDCTSSPQAVRAEVLAGVDVVLHVERAGGGTFRVVHVAEVAAARDGSVGAALRDLFVDEASRSGSRSSSARPLPPTAQAGDAP